MGDTGTSRSAVFFDASPDMLFIAGEDGSLQDVNPAAEKLTGFTRAQLLQKTFSDLAVPEERAAAETYIKSLSSSSPGLLDMRVLCSGGAVKLAAIDCAAVGGLIYGVARDISWRQATRHLLQQSETTLRRILELAPMSMAIVNMDGVIEYINRKAEETFGFPNSEIPTMERWWVLAYPDETYRKEVITRYMGHVHEAIAKDGEIAGEEYLVTCKNGSKKTCFIFGVIAAGKIFVMFDDITRRVEAENALRHSERTLRTIIDQAPISIAIHDMAGNVEHINRKFTQTFGYTLEDMPTLERWAAQAYPEETYRRKLLQLWSDLIDKAVRTDGEIEGGEYKVVSKDRAVKTVFIYGVVTGDGKVVSLLDDVTSRVEAEAALRESESRYRALVETTATGYVIINKEGRVLDANREYVRLSGHKDLKEILGRNVLDWTAEYEKEKNGKAVRQCAADGYIRNFEVDYTGKDGKATPIEVNATVVQSAGVPQILTLCRDISSRRRAEAEIKALNQDLEKRVRERTAELTAANEELVTEISQRIKAERAKEKLQSELLQAQKMDAIGRLAGGIAHDFNNILVSISGYAELLMDTMPDGAPARADLSEILLETQRGASLTRQLMTFSNKQTLKLEILDLNALTTGAGKMLNRLIGANIRLTTELSEGLYPIQADSGQITQVIMNLVINARDAMPEGGRIMIRTENAEITDASPALRLAPPAGSYAVLSVADTGCGMDETTLAHIFEPFYTTKPEGKGTGLGMSTVYGIVSRAKGGIGVESIPGKGTVIRVYFPLANGKQ
jgi:PAS domain S-box-containing protein